MTGHTSSNVLQHLYDNLQAIVRDIAREGDAPGTPRVELTRPSDEKFGDFATNVALMLAPVVRDNPRAVASQIVERAAQLPGVEKIEVAGPGFVNITLDDSWFHATLASVLTAGDRYGADVVDAPERVLLEFVSPNPTGPLVVVSARHAAYGDSLARILAFAGHEVETEIYINDAGNQVDLFGESILARATGREVPENGYQGDYVVELAAEFGVQEGDDPHVLGKRAVEQMVAGMQPQLEAFRTHFDRTQLESELHEQGFVTDAVEKLRSLGQTYEQDGATFLRTTAFGDDKDRAVVRGNGVPTYFAADLGYLEHKYQRGAARIVYVLGADHHGYVARLRAAAQALGHDPESCEIVIMQMVHLVEQGEQRKMSKRRGDFVPFQELLDRIGVDAARFFLVQRSHDQTMELDLVEAAEQNDTNPVYYVQYAHARICSIMRKAAAELELDVEEVIQRYEPSAGLELHGSERRLVKRLAEFPVLVRDAADKRAVHKLPHFALDLAIDFSKFYRDCRVVGDEIERATTVQRLALCGATRQVLARCLDLVGVSAPESM